MSKVCIAIGLLLACASSISAFRGDYAKGTYLLLSGCIWIVASWLAPTASTQGPK